MSETEREQALEALETFRDEMNKITTVVCNIWVEAHENAIHSSPEDWRFEVSEYSIAWEVNRVCRVQLSKARRRRLLEAFMASVTQAGGINSCAMWNYAHLLHHLVYDADMPSH